VEGLLGPPRYQDHPLAAYPVPADASEPAADQLYAFSSEGWHPPEQDGGVWRRWMGDDAQLYLYSTQDETGVLRFTVDSHLDFPLLEVFLGEDSLDSFVVGQRTTVTTRPFTLSAGMNVLRFHAPGGCQPVTDNPACWSEALLEPPIAPSSVSCAPEDLSTTCRTFAFDHVSFVPQEELGRNEAVDVNLGDQIRLRRWEVEDIKMRPGAPLTVTLAWQAAVPLDDQYVVFVHLLSPDGTLVAQHDAPPVGEELPAPAWPQGATFAYPVTIQLPDDLPSGDYRLLTGVYAWPSLERLSVPAEVPGAEVSAVELGSVRIEP
jgi:hypothetical protein